MVTDEFSSHTTGKVFKVKFCASCKSSNVIYLITCRRCGLQYVDETGQSLHLRVNGHQYDITHRKTDESPVAEHFNSGTHTESDMAVMAIDFVRSRDACLQKIQESRWIRTLGTSSLQKWISGLIVYKPPPSLIPLDAFVPLPLWSWLRHPMKKIKIWVMYLNVECVNNLYECNHCIILFVCLLDKDS